MEPVYKREGMNRRRPRIALGILAVAGLLLVGSATAAWAHTPSESPGVESAPAVVRTLVVTPPVAVPPSPAILWLGLAVTVLLGLAVVAPRRVLVATLALALVVLAAETGVHSVHHLTDRHAAAQCAVASASAHLLGTEQPVAPDGAWIAPPTSIVVVVQSVRFGSRPLRPDEGRAPPAA